MSHVIPCGQPSQDGSVPVHDSLWFFSILVSGLVSSKTDILTPSHRQGSGTVYRVLSHTLLTWSLVRSGILIFHLQVRKVGFGEGRSSPKLYRTSQGCWLSALCALFNSDCLLTTTMKQTIKAWEMLWTRGKIIVAISISTPPSICHEVMGPDTMILVFWMLCFKLAFSLSSFTLIRGSLVPLHFLPLGWCHLHIWDYWYFSLQTDGGNNANSDRRFSWAPKSLQAVTAATKLKDACSLEEKLWPT